jgi:prevent-host-death family protein
VPGYTFCTNRGILVDEVPVTTKTIRKTPAVRPSRKSVPARAVPRTPAAAGAIVASLVHVDASTAREQISELLGRVSYGREHIAVDKHGKPKAVLVPLDDYEHYRWLEDYLDGLEGMQALDDYRRSGGASVSSDDVLRKLGLK